MGDFEGDLAGFFTGDLEGDLTVTFSSLGFLTGHLPLGDEGAADLAASRAGLLANSLRFPGLFFGVAGFSDTPAFATDLDSGF